MVIERGRTARGPVGADHDHVQYMTMSAHDQELHQQFVMPFKSETDTTIGSASTTFGSYTTIASGSITVPSWATSASVHATGTIVYNGATSQGSFSGYIDIGSDGGPIVEGHYHNSEDGTATAIHAHTVSDPGSTITVSLNAQSENDLTAQGRLVWLVIFERFD